MTLSYLTKTSLGEKLLYLYLNSSIFKQLNIQLPLTPLEATLLGNTLCHQTKLLLSQLFLK
ncbi:MAG: hypothetical protein K2X66_17535 [Cyanobacteria bacterium]|nr:hypothetical protein [Cyanobacteriota bacterium]